MIRIFWTPSPAAFQPSPCSAIADEVCECCVDLGPVMEHRSFKCTLFNRAGELLDLVDTVHWTAQKLLVTAEISTWLHGFFYIEPSLQKNSWWTKSKFKSYLMSLPMSYEMIIKKLCLHWPMNIYIRYHRKEHFFGDTKISDWPPNYFGNAQKSVLTAKGDV